MTKMKKQNLLGCAFIVVTYSSYAASSDNATFDPNFLKMSDGEEARHLDLKYFMRPGGMSPGTYTVAIFLNGVKVSTEESVEFISDKKQEGVTFPFFNQFILASWGVDVDKYNIEKEPIDKNIPGSTASFSAKDNAIYIKIPQASMRNEVWFREPSATWDDGITSFLVNYNFSGTSQSYDGNKTGNTYGSFESQINYGAWRLKNFSNYVRSSYQKKFKSVSSYLERGFDFFQGGRLTIGQTTTDGTILDSIPLEGITISSDDGMLKPMLAQYSPTIRGIANSPARVIVKQNGNIIYEKNVPAGEFEFNDVTQVYNGDLKIEIVESNGTVREFTQSAAELPVLQRKGRFRYNIALGEYRSDYKEFTKEPRFIQSSFAYGLGYNYTLYGGGIFSEDYKQSTLGLGKYFENFGAFSFDSSFSSAELDNNTVKDGQAYRVMYSKIFSPTDTAFNLAGYKYQSSGYYDFNDFQYVNNGLDFYNQKSRLSVSLSQPLGDELGTFYLSASDDKYWNNGSGYNVNISYSNYIGFVNSSLSFFINKNPSISEVDKAIFISLSIPLDRLSNSLRNNYLNTSVSGSKHSDTQRVGFSGNGLNNQLNYNIYQSFDSRNNSHSGNVDASYVGTYGRVSGGYFYQDNLERFSYGINGGVAIHDEGITLSQPLSLNGANALLKVERANGIKVQNGIGIYTDFRGYTVVPNLTSYSRNKVSIDTSSLDRNIEVSRSGSTVVPTRGALVKTIFETNIGMKVLAEIKDEKGVHIPFGSVVSIDGTEKKSGFIVDDNGVVYLTGMPNKGTLNVQWGSDNSRKCKSEFNLGEVNSTYLKKIYLTCNYNYSG
ncbi:fimbrial biogenesis outer membrane usher protein [Escherichia coli]|nr:fimbrial biogenesis outer membrane usher protein [Escherichia coli]